MPGDLPFGIRVIASWDLPPLDRRVGRPNRKRTCRLYTEEGLQVRTEKRRKLPRRDRIAPQVPERPMQRWSLDFVSDRLADRRRFWVLNRRLMPFVSFDMISYAPGLSSLHAWRFALATLAGIIPASFLLAHFGGEAVSGDLGRATWAVLGLGLVTGAPLLGAAMRRRPEGDTHEQYRKGA